MRIIAALGGNALLRPGEVMSADNQRRNIAQAAAALAPIALEHELVITHGNGPQVGLLALQSMQADQTSRFPLDVLDAETEGMIGYLIEQELCNRLPKDFHCATLMTQIEVDPNDPAFRNPTKPIGPVYGQTEARRIEQARGWKMAPAARGFRRMVSSPRPLKILELKVIEWLVNHHVIVICAGGGGIPVVRRTDGSLIGVEAVIDKDRASSLLAQALQADLLLMLTDVDAVYEEWGQSGARAIRQITPAAMRRLRFEPGSMAPKVEAGCDFVETTGGVAVIGALGDAVEIIRGDRGTRIA